MANVCAAIHEAMGFWWTGFYIERDGMLRLGPFQGPVACYRIPRGRGVCGTAYERRQTIIVPDVEQFPGHIACSSLSRSEIVVPVFSGGAPSASSSTSQASPSSPSCPACSGIPRTVTAVLDIDSTETGTFDDVDATWLEMIAALI